MHLPSQITPFTQVTRIKVSLHINCCLSFLEILNIVYKIHLVYIASPVKYYYIYVIYCSMSFEIPSLNLWICTLTMIEDSPFKSWSGLFCVETFSCPSLYIYYVVLTSCTLRKNEKVYVEGKNRKCKFFEITYKHTHMRPLSSWCWWLFA